MNALVIAPHPDDEVLGCGGTIRGLALSGADVTVAIVTKGWAPLFDEAQVRQVRSEARTAADCLGVRSLRFMDLPVTRLGELPEHEINTAMDRLIDEVQPELVLLPFPGDRHEDHRQIFDAAMVALRPVGRRSAIRWIACYETVSETHWTAPGLETCFDPQVYVDIAQHLEAKLQAMQLYASQLRPPPDARSLVAIESLARWRGSVAGMHAAEAFVLVRGLFR